MHPSEANLGGRIERLIKSIKKAFYSQLRPVELSVWRVPDEPVPFDEAVKQTFRPFALNERWGEPWSTCWFKLSIACPKEWRESDVDLRLDPGFIGDWPGNQAEGILRTADGRILKAINPKNTTWRLPNDFPDEFELFFEVAANPDLMKHGWDPTALGDVLTAPKEPIYCFKTSEIACFDSLVWSLYFDFEVLLGVYSKLPEVDQRRAKLFDVLSRAADVMNHGRIADTANEAKDILAEAYEFPAVPSAHHLHAIGHAHIDCAWLWPLRETERKVLRTFSNVLYLMEQYPDFRFAASSAQQYAWVKKNDPDLFDRIKGAVRRGQWIPVGGQWVEADGNLPSGESLIRQFIFGQRFFEREFGERCPGAWLPDSFGYSGNYPQIAAAADLKWFLTQKISWNQTNQFPHHTFWWEGIDGSRIFTHFCPVDCFDSTMEPEQLMYASDNYKEKARSSHSLLPFGYGDGGGGPVAAMMERYHRSKDLEGLPRVQVDDPDDFFRTARLEYQDRAPVWVGELYLELHRGTFTSQAEAKNGNRRVESLLHVAEYVCTMAAILADAQYPGEELNGIWERALLLQFHDILPGSSTAWVNREANQEYSQLVAKIEHIVRSAVVQLEARLPASDNAKHYINPAPVSNIVLQNVSDVDVKTTVLAHGSKQYTQPLDNKVVRDGNTVTNGLITFKLNDCGMITSLRDETTDRELIPEGSSANQFLLFQDVPNEWDAWDIDRHYLTQLRDRPGAESVVWVEQSDLRCVVELQFSFGKSKITQRLTVTADSKWIDFDNTIEWNERQTLLKWAFPTTMHCLESKSEIQFGHVGRSVCENTSWDDARFETMMHRWLYLSEGSFGLAIANDNVYGYDVRREQISEGIGTTPRLSVLRGPEFPDPGLDIGTYHKRWSVGINVSVETAIERGYQLNIPLVEAAVAPVQLVELEGTGAYLDTLKLADDGSGHVIARIYEGTGSRSRVSVRPYFDVKSVKITDIYEQADICDLDGSEDGRYVIDLKPFQFQTLRFERVTGD